MSKSYKLYDKWEMMKYDKDGKNYNNGVTYENSRVL